MVKITADTGQLIASLDTAEKKTSGFLTSTRSKLAAMRGPLLAVTGAITGMGVLSIKAASDLEQSIGGVRSVFGDAAEEVLAFSETAVDTMGLSRRAFNEAILPLAAMMKNAGVAIDDVADRTLQLSRIAGDLAATYGGTTQDALDALAAAFRGEADPIERFGLSLKITDVNARAVALGLAKTTGAVDATARATAFMSLVMEQTADVQGQFSRESDTLAVKTQKLRARFENLRAELGQLLLPYAERALEWLIKAVTWFDNLPQPVKVATMAVLGFVGALALLGLLLGPILTVVGVIGGVGVAIAAGIAIAVAAIIYFWNTNEEFREAVTNIWEKVKEVVRTAIEAIRGWWERNGEEILAFLKDYWEKIKNIYSLAFELISTIFDKWSGLFKGEWGAFGDFILGVAGNVWLLIVDLLEVAWDAIKDILLAVMDGIAGAFDLVIGILTGDWKRAFEGAEQLFTSFGNVAIAVANAVIGAFEAMVNAIGRAINAIPDIKIPDWVPGMGGNSFGIPDIPNVNLPRIPMLAEGGLVNRPTLAMIGEAGPEAVVPLDRMGGMGGNTFNITVNGNVDSPARAEQLAAEIARKLYGHTRGGGALSVGAR